MNNEEGTFWIILWALLAIVIVFLIGAFGIYHINKNNRLAEARDPMTLACAMDTADVRAGIVCVTYFNSKKN